MNGDACRQATSRKPELVVKWKMGRSYPVQIPFLPAVEFRRKLKEEILHGSPLYYGILSKLAFYRRLIHSIHHASIAFFFTCERNDLVYLPIGPH